MSGAFCGYISECIVRSTYAEEESEWLEKRELLISTHGVSNTLVYILLADLPEIGTLNNKEIGAVVDVATIKFKC